MKLTAHPFTVPKSRTVELYLHVILLCFLQYCTQTFIHLISVLIKFDMFIGAPVINYLLPLNQKLNMHFTVTAELSYILRKNYCWIFACSSKINFHSVGLIAGPHVLAALSDARVTPTSHFPVENMRSESCPVSWGLRHFSLKSVNCFLIQAALCTMNTVFIQAWCFS
jgi:hypothetical protein